MPLRVYDRQKWVENLFLIIERAASFVVIFSEEALN
jgi:hypothetical protein